MQENLYKHMDVEELQFALVHKAITLINMFKTEKAVSKK